MRSPLAYCTLTVFLASNHGRAFSIQSNRVHTNGSNPSMLKEPSAGSSKHFRIEQVVTKKRALDVKIFRQFSVTPVEYIQQKNEGFIDGEQILISEEEAIDLLMQGYDDQGNYIHISSENLEVYFVAVHNGCEESKEGDTLCDYSRQNGVIGVVRAQIVNQGSSATLNGCNNASAKEDMPPHVYLSNLSVDGTQRRQGVGTALLSAVSSYTKLQEGVNLVILSVDSDNIGAIRMYEKHGYKFLDQDDITATMFLA